MSAVNLILLLSVTSLNAGHPHPESYFDCEENNCSPQTTHEYIPLSFNLTYSPVNGLHFNQI